jgi:hypothetical protein
MLLKQKTILHLVACLGLLVMLVPNSLAQEQTPPPPAHPVTLPQIEKMMALTHSIDRIKTLMHSNIEIQKNQKPQILPPAFWADFEEEMDKVDWVKIATPVYQRYFSVEEADSVIAFYSTPVGQKVLASSTVITQELSAQGYAIGKEAGERIAQKYQKEIQENTKKTQQPQPNISPQP